MPPKPFPFPIRVGTDICSIARIHKLLANKSPHLTSSPLHRFVPKLLTWPEQQYFWHRFKGAKSNQHELDKVSQFLAGRWAAKEACRKACEHLGTSNGFHTIMILPVTTSPDTSPGATSRPQALILPNRLPEVPSTALHAKTFDINSVDGQLCEVSISHDTHWATAVALVPVM